MKTKRKIIYGVIDLYCEKQSDEYNNDVEVEILSEMLIELDFLVIKDPYSAIKQVIKNNPVDDEPIDFLHFNGGSEELLKGIVVEKLVDIVKEIDLQREIIAIEIGNLSLNDLDIDKIEEKHIIAKYKNIVHASKGDYDLVEKRVKQEIRNYFENMNIYKFYKVYKSIQNDIDFGKDFNI